jgi:hypothetical protein
MFLVSIYLHIVQQFGQLMASSFVSQSASFVLFVDNVRVGTLENRVPISLQIPSVAVPVAVLPIISEDGLNLQIVNSTSNRDEV